VPVLVESFELLLIKQVKLFMYSSSQSSFEADRAVPDSNGAVFEAVLNSNTAVPEANLAVPEASEHF
jgi:hypothetical protein